MSGDDFRPLECGSYTHARRHPSVLGKVGGAALPFGPYTPTQGIVFFVLFASFYFSRNIWGAVITAPFLKITVLFGIPAAAMFLVRNLRIEGRSPFFFAIGVITFLSAPRYGRLRGRRARRPPIKVLFAHRIGTTTNTTR